MGRSFSVKFLVNHIINVVLVILALVFDDDSVRNYSQYLYLVLVLNYVWIIFKKNSLLLFFTPSALIIFYVGISFALGSYAFNEGLVLDKRDLFFYNNWEYLSWSNFYMTVCLMVLLYLDHNLSHVYLRLKKKAKRYQVPQKTWRAVLVLSGIIYIIFSFIPLSAGLFGGSGDMSIVPKTISVLIFIYYLAIHKVKSRFILYGIILLVFAFLSVESKREAIFLFFPIGLLESYLNYSRIKLKYLIGISIGVGFCLYLIILMSIVRGYGGFNIEGSSLNEAFPLVMKYLNSNQFLESFFYNIETNYTYFHSFQALEYIQNDPSLMTFGSTIIKFVFVFIPRSVFPAKPDSIIDLYTSEYAPLYRDSGGSYVINVFSEFFWNYHFLGLILVIVMFIGFHYLFKKMLLKMGDVRLLLNIWLLYAYMQILTYVRGSGLDQYFIYVVMGFFFSLLIGTAYKLLSPKYKISRH